LRVAAGVPAPWEREGLARYHRRLAANATTPMDEAPEVAPDLALDPVQLEEALLGGLERAAGVGLVEVTEAGVFDWAYPDALLRLRDRRDGLPVRVRLLVASGLAGEEGAARVAARRTGDVWVEVLGVKFYADGWVRSRTCALREPFADEPDSTGVMFLDALRLARRAAPFAEAGLVIATHAIGDAAVEAALDAYEMVWGGQAPAAGQARIEHAQVLSPELVSRLAESGVTVCIQPGFAVSDAAEARAALGPERAAWSYCWAELVSAGVQVVMGSDHPVEDLKPLSGLGRLVGEPPEGLPAARLPYETALGLMTDAASGATLLVEDPAFAEPDEIANIEVLSVEPAP